MTIVSGGQIANVTEIGFVFTNDTNVANAARIQIFDVNMTVIPEPPVATSVLLSGFGLFVALRRRFRQ